MKKEINNKPQVNLVANIINNHFLDSEYQGKDWEAVRKSLIKELSELFDQERERIIEMIDIEIDCIKDGNALTPYEQSMCIATARNIINRLKTQTK